MMYSSQSLSLQKSTIKITRTESQFRHPDRKEENFTLISLKLMHQALDCILHDCNRGLNKIMRDITEAVDEMMFIFTRLID